MPDDMAKPWYLIEARATVEATEGGEDRVAEIYILEEIGEDWWTGDGVGAKAFIDDVKALGSVDRIELHVASPGGNVIDGLAIYNFLRQHPAPVTAYVDGIAASVASVIVMAADEVVMPENALLMIHDPWTWTAGNASDLRKTADDLDKIKEGLLSAYTRKSGLDRDRVWDLMEAETWLSARECLEMGLCDRVDEPVRVAALADVEQAKARVRDLIAQRSSSGALSEDAEPCTAQGAEDLEVDAVEPQAAASPSTMGAIVARCREHRAECLAVLAMERKASLDDVERWLGWLRDTRALAAGLELSDECALGLTRAIVEKGAVAALRQLAGLLLNRLDGPEVQGQLPVEPGPAGPRIHDIYTKRRAQARQKLSGGSR